LRDQLRLQADGQTGQLEAIGPTSDRRVPGCGGESWERGPYYLDGLVPLAYVLADAELHAKAQKWIEAILAGQRPDGQFGPADDDWWPRMVACKLLTQYADATGDDRVLPFLQGYFSFQHTNLADRPLHGWGKARAADNILSVPWLHERRPADWLLELARTVLAQTQDWAGFLINHLPAGPVPTFRNLTHGPNVAMGLKTAAVAMLLDGGPAHLDETRRMFQALEDRHGLVHGVFSGAEWLGGR